MEAQGGFGHAVDFAGEMPAFIVEETLPVSE
jgi:hypothetical protein